MEVSMLENPEYSSLGEQEEGSRKARSAGVWAVVARFVPGTLVFLVAGISDSVVGPFERNVDEYANGPTISHPKLVQTVSAAQLYIYSWLLPAFIIISLCAVRRNWVLLQAAGLGLLETSAITLALTNFAKKTAGSLRPNFYSLCGWNGTACTGPSEAVMSARQSFPSGHASIGGAGLTFLALFMIVLAKKTLKPDAYYDTYLSIVRLVSVLPVLFAVWIAITRTIDYYHRFEDIVGGLALGIGVAFSVAACHFREDKKR